MKATFLIITTFFINICLFSQEKMYICKSDKMILGVAVSEVDSIYFNEDRTIALFQISDTLVQYPVSEIDSIIFGENSTTISIKYDNSDVAVINPMAFEGVAVTVEGSDVTVYASSGIQDITYNLSGNTSNGMFKIYSDKRFNLIMNAINITNPVGPAINNQANKKATIILSEGTTNTIADGPLYNEPSAGEDQKGTFFSEGDLVFSGTGLLTIHSFGTDQHALACDDEIEINGGNITISGAAKDGIHASDGILITGGTLNVAATGDGIDGDEGYVEISGGLITTTNNTDSAKGIACDSIMVISGGNVNITVNGDQSKGLKSNSPITLSGGSITIHNTGDAVLQPSGLGFDPSYCTAIKSNDDIIVDGADITIVTSGKAGKGLSSDSDIIMSDGSVNVTSTGNGATYTNTSGVLDAYVSTCLSSDGNITIDGGTLTTFSSGSGGKGISSDAQISIGTSDLLPAVQITTTGVKIHISGSGGNASYAEAKAVKGDSDIIIDKGNVIISSADDGIKSETSIVINEATVTIQNSYEGLEAPFITINGGTVHIYASDDGINATFGSGGEQNDGSLLSIAGGYIFVSTTNGDGLDSNGSVLINGGTTIIHGPQSAPEVAIDYNGTCNMNAGFLIASGTNSNMTQAPNNTSVQYCLEIMSNQSMSSSTLFHIQDASSNSMLTFQPVRNYYSIIFSSSELQSGTTYSIYTGGSCTGTNVDGLYNGGTYSGGTLKKTFTISSKITNVNF